MSSHRHKCLMSFYKNSESEIILIDKSNLYQWVASNLHPAYKLLSYTHRADYLRCYFMHNFGGGYSDIKFCRFSWNHYFLRLKSSEKLLMSGYTERKATDIASEEAHIKNSYANLPGMGHFIFKPKSELTYRWINQVHSCLDHVFKDLYKYPGIYHPRAVNGGVHDSNIFARIRFFGNKYPIEWNSLLGKILHPLSYQFKDRISLAMPYVDTLTRYR